MALDPETLQNQTATANQNQHDAAYSQIELIARNMAELGWRRVFRQMLRLIVKHQDRSRVIRLRDRWVEMDPRHWNANMDVTIKRNYVTDLQLSHATLGAATEVAIRDGAGGAVLWRATLGTVANENICVQLATPVFGSVNTLLEVVTLSAVTGGVYVNGKDKASEIAAIARDYDAALKAAGYGEAMRGEPAEKR